MSQHKSLQGTGGIIVKRNVLSALSASTCSGSGASGSRATAYRAFARRSPTSERALHDLIQRLLASYQHSLQSGGYLYIVFLMALESSVIPLPSELVIPPAVLLVDAGHSSMSLPGIVLAAAIGSLLGASIMYWASRIAGRPLVVRYGKLMLVPMEQVERAERWAAKSGGFGRRPGPGSFRLSARDRSPSHHPPQDRAG